MTRPETPPFRVDGRTAVVTGAGRGIGAAAAVALAEAGADLVLISRTAADLARVAAAVEGLGRKATAIPCDVTSLGQLTAAFARVETVDILVSSAGSNIPDRSRRCRRSVSTTSWRWRSSWRGTGSASTRSRPRSWRRR